MFSMEEMPFTIVSLFWGGGWRRKKLNFFEQSEFCFEESATKPTIFEI